jgi:hypothetical protein
MTARIAKAREINQFDKGNPLGDPWRLLEQLEAEIEASRQVNADIIGILRCEAVKSDAVLAALTTVEQYLERLTQQQPTTS